MYKCIASKYCHRQWSMLLYIYNLIRPPKKVINGWLSYILIKWYKSEQQQQRQQQQHGPQTFKGEPSSPLNKFGSYIYKHTYIWDDDEERNINER